MWVFRRKDCVVGEQVVVLRGCFLLRLYYEALLEPVELVHFLVRVLQVALGVLEVHYGK